MCIAERKKIDTNTCNYLFGSGGGGDFASAHCSLQNKYTPPRIVEIIVDILRLSGNHPQWPRA